MKTATKPATAGTLHYCEACKKRTRHGPVVERTDERDQISRCHECGQRPDRPLEGHTIKVNCPQCGKKTTARYCDDDGMDCYASQCESCGPVMLPHDDLIKSQTKAHKLDQKTAQEIADKVMRDYTTDLVIALGQCASKMTSVTITVGSATATARKA